MYEKWHYSVMDYEDNRFPERGLVYKLRSLPGYFWGASDLCLRQAFLKPWQYVKCLPNTH